MSRNILGAELTRKPCNSARSRTGGWHPSFKPIHFYPDYYWCTHCGGSPHGGARLEGWKHKDTCRLDTLGAPRCPDCGRKVRTQPKPYNVLRAKRRKEKQRSGEVKR